MAIVAADILTKFSIAAAAGNTTTSAAGTSLGDQISTTQWTGGSLNDLFDDVSGAENAASTVDYRGIFIHNNHGSLTASNISVFLSAEVAGGASIALSIDNIAASAIGSGSTQMATIASEITAPTGVGAYSSPTTDGTGLSLGALTAGQCRGIWIRRTAANSAALNADGFTLGISFDTPA